MKLETIMKLESIENSNLQNAFNKGYLDAMINDNSSIKLDLRLTIFINDDCIACMKVNKIKKIKINEQLGTFVLQLDNDVILYCNRIDVMKWTEE